MTEYEEMTEKTLVSGEILTIAKVKNGIDVDCWDDEGNNRWNRFFPTGKETEAQAEYDRWN